MFTKFFDRDTPTPVQDKANLECLNKALNTSPGGALQDVSWDFIFYFKQNKKNHRLTTIKFQQ